MSDNASLTLRATSTNGNLNIEITNITGSSSEAISNKRLIEILSNAIVCIAIGDDEHEMNESEFMELAISTMNNAFITPDLDVYRIPKNP